MNHMNGHDIVQTSNDKDLGIISYTLMKFSLHTQFVTSKANRTIGFIKMSFINFSEETFTYLYKIFVQPQTKYGKLKCWPFYSLDQ